MRESVFPPIDTVTTLVQLGVVVDSYLEQIGESRPGEAWSDCATRIEGRDPGLSAWLRHAERRWEEMDSVTLQPAPGEDLATPC